jgi:hypothetical protein
MTEALLATLLLLPAVISYFLKSNAAVSFLALCGGFAVSTLSSSDIQHLFGKTKITSLTSDDVSLLLLAVPLILSLLFTFKAVSSRSMRLAHVIPAICAGGLLAAVSAPVFSQAMNINLAHSALWKDLQSAQSYIVALGLLVSLLLVWASGFSHGRSHGKHGKKKHK